MSNHQIIYIKKPIFLPMLGGLLVLLVVFVLSTLWTVQEQKATIFEQSRASMMTQYRETLDAAVMELWSHAEIISRIEALKAAFTARNRDLLLEQSLPINKSLLNNNAITHFYFHDLNRTNFLRVHQPQRYGDQIDRLTLLKAEKSGTVAHGIEIGPLGTMTLRVVLPWQSGGKTIGYIELGKEVDRLVDSLKCRSDLSFYIFARKALLSKPEERTKEALGMVSNWDMFPDVVLMDKPGTALPDGLQSYVLSGILNQDDSTRKQGEKLVHAVEKFHFFNIPVNNPDNVSVGHLVVSYDFRSFLSAFYSNIVIILCASIVVVILLAFVFYKHLDTVEGKIRSIARKLQDSEARIRHEIGRVTETAEQVQSLTNRISEAIDEEVTSATEQSAAVSEITASMEELSATSNQISENAALVLAVASQTLEVAELGRDAAEQVMQKMREINDDNQKNINEVVELGRKSQEINKVMLIINRIADQTKLIAFNAAIEASSAGEAGTRFGVVAVEIRRLADSVMESTSEISDNLQEIQEGVNRLVVASEKGSKGIREGSELTEGTARFLGEIYCGVESTNDSARQISLSTQQQKTATAQVVVALREIEDGSQMIVNSVRKTNETCDALTQLSRNLSVSCLAEQPDGARVG